MLSYPSRFVRTSGCDLFWSYVYSSSALKGHTEICTKTTASWSQTRLTGDVILSERKAMVAQRSTYRVVMLSVCWTGSLLLVFNFADRICIIAVSSIFIAGSPQLNGIISTLSRFRMAKIASVSHDVNVGIRSFPANQVDTQYRSAVGCGCNCDPRCKIGSNGLGWIQWQMQWTMAKVVEHPIIFYGEWLIYF